jgi:8-oxo-dGTP pyrophosphatase MutT (NUDIX family)
MPLVKCRTLFNKEKYVDSAHMVQRPSVYGVVIHGGQLLVVRAQHTLLYVLPGGGIEKGETIHDALIREVREETDIVVQIGQFLHVETDFFYYDPLDLAIHGFLFFYACVATSTTLNTPDYPPEEGLIMPIWVNIATLHADQFQSHGTIIMQMISGLAAQNSIFHR